MTAADLPELPADSVYVPDGDLFAPTELARGPWAIDAQHGGPPAALLARAVEAHEPDPDMAVVRMTVELLRPVPFAPLGVRTRTVRPGKRVQLVEASLLAGDTEVTRATALRLRAGAELPDGVTTSGPAPPDPETLSIPDARPPFRWNNFGMANDLRFVAGGGLLERGPSIVWFRLRVPLVAGEEISPLSRVMAAADFGNGVSSVVDFLEWSFINPDLTVYLQRPPVDEWVCLDAVTWAATRGTGVAESALFDRRGRIGRGVQSLVYGRQ